MWEWWLPLRSELLIGWDCCSWAWRRFILGAFCWWGQPMVKFDRIGLWRKVTRLVVVLLIAWLHAVYLWIQGLRWCLVLGVSTMTVEMFQRLWVDETEWWHELCQSFNIVRLDIPTFLWWFLRLKWGTLVTLLHGIVFRIVLQNPYLAMLEFLDHDCQVWFCLHLCLAIDVICANTFSSVIAMDDNLRLWLVCQVE